jgi:hypothetical protein
MPRRRCLYCGSKFWRPFRWLRDGEFCSRDHRESYQGRLRKIAGDLTEHQDPSSVTPEAKDPDSLVEQAPPLMAAFLPLSKDISAQAPVERGKALTESLPPAFETRVRINRWSLRIRFFR